MSLCISLGLCGMSLGSLYHMIMSIQAETQKAKSEYVEARSIHNTILEETSIQDPYDYGYALLNFAKIDGLIGAPKNDVQRNYLYLREGNSLAANTMFKRCLKKAFQFLGDVYLSQNDEYTAISLFTVALEGFTQMDVHHSRAECMLQLGDISKGHGDLLKAVEFWEAARPLFERSSQAKQVENIDGRLVSVGGHALGQHRNNLDCLAELNSPTRTVEELEDELSDIEDLAKIDMGDLKEPGLIAA
ncbi:hypothetical protein B0H13DRAFT_1880406 [Mycena leptocephala]|nr:hypothetical protein B0H13DRAFT_1880406 [Mycena leptocephala]